MTTTKEEVKPETPLLERKESEEMKEIAGEKKHHKKKKRHDKKKIIKEPETTTTTTETTTGGEEEEKKKKKKKKEKEKEIIEIIKSEGQGGQTQKKDDKSSNSSNSSLMSMIGDELIGRILWYISAHERNRMQAVSRRWRDVIRREISWSHVGFGGTSGQQGRAIVTADGVVSKAARSASFGPPMTTCRMSDGDLVAVLPRLSNLTHLSFRWCRSLTDESFSRVVASLGQLVFVDIGGTRVSTPEAMGSLPRGLKALQACECDRMSNAGVAAAVRRCPGMTDVDVGGTRIGDAAVATIAGSLAGVTRVSLASCKWVSSSGAASLVQAAKTLEEVDLTNTLTDDGTVEAIARSCSSLRSLRIARCRNVGDPGIASAAHCRRLSTLDASTTITSDPGIGQLAGLDRLISLSIAWSNVSDKGLARLEALHSLRSLDLSWTRVSSAAVCRLSSCCKSLKFIKLEGCPNVSDEIRSKFI